MSVQEDAAPPSSAQDNAQAKRFRTVLDPTATKFTFALFDDKRDEKRAAGIKLNVPRPSHTTLERVWALIRRHNSLALSTTPRGIMRPM